MRIIHRSPPSRSIFFAATARPWPGPSMDEVSKSRKIRNTSERTPLYEWSVATFTTNKITQDTNIYALSGMFFFILLYSALHPYLGLCLGFPAFCLSVFTYDTQHKHPCKAGFEPAIPATKRLQTHALNHTAHFLHVMRIMSKGPAPL